MRYLPYMSVDYQMPMFNSVSADSTSYRNTHSCFLCGMNHVEKLSYFGFPKDPVIKKIWEEFCGLQDNSDIQHNVRLCNKHFTDDSFQKPGGMHPRLLANAVPSIRVNELSNSNVKWVKVDQNRPHHKSTHSCFLCGTNHVEKLSYFGLPKNPDIRTKWEDFCGLRGYSDDKFSFRLCNKHFTEDCFRKRKPGSTHPRLQPNAVPSIHVNEKPNVNDSVKQNTVSVDSPGFRNSHSCLICKINHVEKLSYFRFPKDPVLRERWVNFCKMQGCSVVLRHAYLCNKHFTSDSFRPRHENVRPLLKPNAVPSVVVGKVSNIKNELKTEVTIHDEVVTTNSPTQIYYNDDDSADPGSELEEIIHGNVVVINSPTSQICDEDSADPDSELEATIHDSTDLSSELEATIHDNVVVINDPNSFIPDYNLGDSDTELEETVHDDVVLINNPTSLVSDHNSADSDTELEETIHDNVMVINNPISHITDHNISDIGTDFEAVVYEEIVVTDNTILEINVDNPANTDSTHISAHTNYSEHNSITRNSSTKYDRKRRKSLRYIFDFDESDVSTATGATKFLGIVKKRMRRYQRDQDILRKKLKRANQKIRNLENLLIDLLQNDS